MTLHPRETVILPEDFQALVDWYKSVLGFRATRLFEGKYHYCNLESESGIRLGIAVGKEMGVSPGDRKSNTIILQFQVPDVRGFLTPPFRATGICVHSSTPARAANMLSLG